MGDVRSLTDDVLATAASLGLDAVDARPALAAAEPGAFLNGDLHLSPKGHRAVANALAEALRRDRDATRPRAQSTQSAHHPRGE
jgi:hypothetical protein